MLRLPKDRHEHDDRKRAERREGREGVVPCGRHCNPYVTSRAEARAPDVELPPRPVQAKQEAAKDVAPDERIRTRRRHGFDAREDEPVDLDIDAIHRDVLDGPRESEGPDGADRRQVERGDNPLGHCTEIGARIELPFGMRNVDLAGRP